KSSTKNLVPIPHECEVTSDNGSESIEPIKDDSSVFTTFLNSLFNNDKINSDELNSHVESNFVESTSNHDTVKIDNLDKFSGPLIPIHIAEEERIRREHADYINRIEMLFTINPRPRPMLNANKNVESIPPLPIPIQDNNSQREEIDIVTSTDDVLLPSVENENSDGEVDAFDDLRVDNSISNSEHEFSESEDSNFDNPSVPLLPPEPSDEEFDFKIDFGDEISVGRDTIVKFECINARVKFDVFNNENDDCSYCMFAKVFSFLSAESEDTIFDPATRKYKGVFGNRYILGFWKDLGCSAFRLARNQSSNPSASTNPNPKGRNRRRPKQRIENLDLDDLSEPIDTMADQRTMTQLFQAPTEGYEDAIVVPAITAENFEMKHGLLTHVQNK
nr:reverse transcriptase domain-containing protein [Tanacetum cinerariifolium]